MFPPTGCVRFGGSAGSDGLVSAKPVGFNVHTVWGWFRMRQDQTSLLVQMCGAALESVAPDGSGPYQLLFETTFQTNTVELHDNANGGFLFTPTMQPMEWWFIASVNNRDAAPSAGQTSFYARKMGDSSPLVAITGNKHPAATKVTRFLVGTDDAGGQNEWWDGDICGLGVAARPYSTAEVDAQSRQLYPVSRDRLHAFYPLTDTATMLLDASGQNRHLAPITTGGSWAARTDGPQIPLGNFSALPENTGPVPLHSRMPVGQSHARFSGMDRGFRAFVPSTEIPGAVTVTGTIAVVEADDALAAAGSTVTGSTAVTEADDGLAAIGSTVTGTSGLVEAGDVVAATGSTVTGSSALTEANDTVAASGSVVDFVGTVAVTEAGDTVAATGSSTTGTAALTEAADVASGSGAVVDFIGSAALVEADDTCAASGSFTASGVTGSAALTEAGDTLSASGSSVTGSAALTEAGDALAASGTWTNTGAAALVEASDTASGTGSSVTGAAALTQASDVAAGAGSSTTGTAGLVESPNTLGSSGAHGVAGSAAVAESGDVFAGAAAHGVAGAIALVEADDVLRATDHVPITGTAALLEAPDTFLGHAHVIEVLRVTGYVAAPLEVIGLVHQDVELVTASTPARLSITGYAVETINLTGYEK